MEKVRLSELVIETIYCPFCGQGVMSEEMAPEVNPCPNTLFLGTSEGFEHVSETFRELCESQLNRPFASCDDVYDLDINDVMTAFDIAHAVSFEIIPCPPACLSAYAAFQNSVETL